MQMKTIGKAFLWTKGSGSLRYELAGGHCTFVGATGNYSDPNGICPF
jgi:hypothetical protein